MKISAENFPIIVQVVGPHLMVMSKDFDTWLAEKYEPKDPGQTVLLMMRLRSKIERIMKERASQGREIPSPTPPRDIDLDSPQLLSASEAARLLKVSRQTLWRMETSGKIRSEQTPGGHRRYSRSIIESMQSAEPKTT